MKTKLFSIFLLLSVAVGLYAYQGYIFRVDGNYYRVINDTLEPYTVEITGDWEYRGNPYSNLETFVIPETVTERECTYKCTYNVVSIDAKAFSGCSKLKSITMPNSITDIGSNAFENCTSLNSITFSNNLRIIGPGAFRDCTSLDSITIPNNVIGIMWEAFRNCTSLKSIILPDTLLYIDSYLFKDCSSLRTITIPDSVRSIDHNAFENCTSLDSISIPGRVEYIADRAFTGCSKLRCITIEEGVQEIGEEVFAKDNRDSAIVNVTIPRSVRTIDKKAFYNCRVENIEINSEDCRIRENAFGNDRVGVGIIKTYVKLHYPYNIIAPEAFGARYPGELEIIVPCGMVANYRYMGHKAPSYLRTDTTTQYQQYPLVVHSFNTPTITADIVQGEWDTPRCGVDIVVTGECSPDTALIYAYTEYVYTEYKDTDDFKDECIFVSWGDGNTDNPRKIVFTQDTTIIAHFERLAFEVTIDENPDLGKVSVSPKIETYYCNKDTIILTVTPNDGYIFKGWSDGNVDNPRTLVVTDNVILSPIYEKVTALDGVLSDSKKPYKVIYQGQMYIICDGVIYTATGTKL